MIMDIEALIWQVAMMIEKEPTSAFSRILVAARAIHGSALEEALLIFKAHDRAYAEEIIQRKIEADK
jgi:hypothetical protein